MAISSGLHHVAIMTSDLDRLIAFYVSVFDAEVQFDMTEEAPGVGPIRHAMLDLGGGCSLHPFEMPFRHDHDVGLPSLGRRGHIDHLAIQMPDETSFQDVRKRLVASGACDGTETDFGSMKLVMFNDPDGMECEIAIGKPDHTTLPAKDRIRRPFEG